MILKILQEMLVELKKISEEIKEVRETLADTHDLLHCWKEDQ